MKVRHNLSPRAERLATGVVVLLLGCSLIAVCSDSTLRALGLIVGGSLFAWGAVVLLGWRPPTIEERFNAAKAAAEDAHFAGDIKAFKRHMKEAEALRDRGLALAERRSS